MTDILASDAFGSRAESIWRKLATCIAAAAIIGASPAIYAAPPPMFTVTMTGLSEPHQTDPTTISSDAFATKLERTRLEIAIAQRLLRAFGDEFLPEFDGYLSTLDVVLRTEVNSLSAAERLGLGLRQARVAFENEASSVRVWARLAACVDGKDESGRRVPRRFVRVQAPEPDLPIAEEWPSYRVRHAVRSFADVDADTSPATS
jgi:hypothetical protein